MNSVSHRFTWRSLAAGAVMLVSFGMTPAIAEGKLTVGEYGCYGSDGVLLIGLGFKVLDDSTYTDLDGKESGQYSVDGSTVSFQGGNLDGYVGTDLKDGTFNIRTVTCQRMQ